MVDDSDEWGDEEYDDRDDVNDGGSEVCIVC